MKIGDTIYFIDVDQRGDLDPRIQTASIEKTIPSHGQFLVGWRTNDTHMGAALFLGGQNWHWFTDADKAGRALRRLPKLKKDETLWTLDANNQPEELRFGYFGIGQRNFKIRCFDSRNERRDFEFHEMRKTLFASQAKAAAVSRRASFSLPFFSKKVR